MYFCFFFDNEKNYIYIFSGEIFNYNKKMVYFLRKHQVYSILLNMKKHVNDYLLQ